MEFMSKLIFCVTNYWSVALFAHITQFCCILLHRNFVSFCWPFSPNNSINLSLLIKVPPPSYKSTPPPYGVQLHSINTLHLSNSYSVLCQNLKSQDWSSLWILFVKYIIRILQLSILIYIPFMAKHVFGFFGTSEIS